MISTKKTLLAKEIASKAHAGQFDKAGQAYILHPLHLAEGCDDEKTTIVALLHDVFEDSDLYSFEDLSSFGYEEDIIEALKLLTHDKNVDYMDYIAAICNNELARRIKILDIRHNLDLSRIPDNLMDEYMRRMGLKRNLYIKALEILEEKQSIIKE